MSSNNTSYTISGIVPNNSIVDLFEKNSSVTYDAVKYKIETIISSFVRELILAITDGVNDWADKNGYYHWETVFIYMHDVSLYKCDENKDNKYKPKLFFGYYKDLLDVLEITMNDDGSFPDEIDNDIFGIINRRADFSNLNFATNVLLSLLDEFCIIKNNSSVVGSVVPEIVKCYCNPLPTDNSPGRKACDRCRYKDLCKNKYHEFVKKLRKGRNLVAHSDNREANAAIQTTVSNSSYDIENDEIYKYLQEIINSINDDFSESHKIFKRLSEQKVEDLKVKYNNFFKCALEDYILFKKGYEITDKDDVLSYKQLTSYYILVDSTLFGEHYNRTVEKIWNNLSHITYILAISKNIIMDSSDENLSRNTDMFRDVIAQGRILWSDPDLNPNRSDEKKAILKFLSKNADKKFCIMTQDDAFAREIIKINKQNFIAAKIEDRNGKVRLWK